MRRLRWVLVSSSLIVLLLPGVVSARPRTATVLDSLGDATPATAFSVFGSGGAVISPLQLAGAEFVLRKRTVVTEIGGFLNNCKTIISGVAQCPDTRPFVVQVRPSRNGLPDPVKVLATFELSHDNDPTLVSYESARMRLRLPAGRYFALFAAQGSDVGFLLSSASSPFSYLAGSLREAIVTLADGAAYVRQNNSAMRVLARK